MVQRRSHAGLSLAEIVIVMGIVAVLVAVGVPFYLRWRANQELRSSAERLLSAIRLTQSLAMRFAHGPTGLEMDLAVGGCLGGALTGQVPDVAVQCNDLGSVVDGLQGGSGGSDAGSTSGSSSSSGGTLSKDDPGGAATSGSSGSSGSSTGGTSSGGSGGVMCSIVLKRNENWSVHSREYVDRGVSMRLTPAVSFTSTDVSTSSQSAISVGGTDGIAFLSNGALYSHTQTQLQLTSASTGRVCVITVTPNGGVSLQQ